jgi:hypothetical protein
LNELFYSWKGAAHVVKVGCFMLLEQQDLCNILYRRLETLLTNWCCSWLFNIRTRQ